MELSVRSPCHKQLSLAALVTKGYMYLAEMLTPPASQTVSPIFTESFSSVLTRKLGHLSAAVDAFQSAVESFPTDPFAHASLADALSWGRGIGFFLSSLGSGSVPPRLRSDLGLDPSSSSSADVWFMREAFLGSQTGRMAIALDHYHKAHQILRFAELSNQVSMAARGLGGSSLGTGLAATDVWQGGWLGLCACCACDCGTCADVDASAWPLSMWTAASGHDAPHRLYNHPQRTPFQSSQAARGDAFGLSIRVSLRLAWLLLQTGDDRNALKHFRYGRDLVLARAPASLKWRVLVYGGLHDPGELDNEDEQSSQCSHLEIQALALMFHAGGLVAQRQIAVASGSPYTSRLRLERNLKATLGVFARELSRAGECCSLSQQGNATTTGDGSCFAVLDLSPLWHQTSAFLNMMVSDGCLVPYSSSCPHDALSLLQGVPEAPAVEDAIRKIALSAGEEDSG